MFFAYLAFYKFYAKNIFYLIGALLLSLFLPILLRFFLEQKVYLWLFEVTNYNLGTTFSYYYVDNTYFATYYIPSGILYYFYKRNTALQQSKIQAEKASVEAELTHLRSQINPHFLFNSLNNIYALANEKSDRILPALENLSELLRYALYEKSKTVSFSKEWEKIQRLNALEQLRLENPVNIQLDIDPKVDNVAIPPLILLPIIENVYKHGKLNGDGIFKIKAYILDSHFLFRVENTISPYSQKNSTNGIGLENIQKRLLYLYGTTGTITFIQQNQLFITEIKIPIL